jgi:hypothetical protein
MKIDHLHIVTSLFEFNKSAKNNFMKMPSQNDNVRKYVL